MDALAAAATLNPAMKPYVERLRSLVDRKLDELLETVELRKAGRVDEALAIVNNNSGRDLMSAIRKTLGAMRAEQARSLEERLSRLRLLDRLGRAALLGALFAVAGLGVMAVRSARGRIDALQSTVRELEEATRQKKAAEAQVAQLQRMEAIGQLTGGIAHDFNNMLAIVIGSLDLARRRLVEQPNSRVLKYIEQAADGANRAATLTARLLAFSRHQPLEPSVLDVNRLVAKTSELLRQTLGEDIDIETVLAGGLWGVFADAAQLENALVNLAVNARDAMPGGGKLTIDTANSDLDDRYAAQHNEVAPGQYVMISVTDSGAGMAPEIVERAFDPFFTTKEAGKGTGLGLSQVFGFVKQSGGHVKIYSELNKGTTVKIYLPRHFGPAAAEQGAAPEKLPAGSPDTLILVVEDDAMVRRTTVAELRELGYTVVHAGSPQEALAKIDANPGVALLLTDVVLPEMNGRQLADLARKRLPELKVLFTTGYTRNAIVHNGLVDPGVAFLPKPFTVAQLAAKVSQALR